MNAKLNGARSKNHRPSVDGLNLSMPADLTIAATPESISWTQTPDQRAAALRRDRIAVAAYLMSEARGFAPGHDTEDWLDAQNQIDGSDDGTSQV